MGASRAWVRSRAQRPASSASSAAPAPCWSAVRRGASSAGSARNGSRETRPRNSAAPRPRSPRGRSRKNHYIGLADPIYRMRSVTGIPVPNRSKEFAGMAARIVRPSTRSLRERAQDEESYKRHQERVLILSARPEGARVEGRTDLGVISGVARLLPATAPRAREAAPRGLETMDLTELASLRQYIGRTQTVSDMLTPGPPALLAATIDRDDPPHNAGHELPPTWHRLYFLTAGR